MGFLFGAQILVCDKAKGWADASQQVNSKKQYLKTRCKKHDTVRTWRRLAGRKAAVPYQPAENLDGNIQAGAAEGRDGVQLFGSVPCVRER